MMLSPAASVTLIAGSAGVAGQDSGSVREWGGVVTDWQDVSGNRQLGKAVQR